MTQRALSLELGPWFRLKDGDARLREFYNRHYSSRGGDAEQIVGPGNKLVLLTHAIDAIFAWRRFKDACPLARDVNCAVFRNESAQLASSLIVAAEEFARDEWGHVRAYTYVAPERVRSVNPGYCFLCAGWTRVGITAGGHGRPRLLVLEKQL